MATIEQLITRLETRLALVAGLDVQVHAEDRLVEMLRHKYNTLFDDHWYPEYTHFMTKTLDGTTGQITDDISASVLRYKDIAAVFYDTDDRPLPQLSTMSNPSRIRTRCIAPSSLTTRVFKMYPLDTEGDVHIWYRTRLTDDVWDDGVYDTEVPMDDELLLLGSTYDFIVDDGSNDRAEKKYLNMFNARLAQVRADPFQMPFSKRPQQYDGPADRWE